MSWRDRIVQSILAGKVGGPHEGGIMAYHSSPYDFDKFDWSKLRTGEGANTYGAGFYAAENPAVSGQGGQYWNQFLPRSQNPELEAAQILRNNNFDRATAVEEVKGLVKHYDDKHSRDMLKLLESGQPLGPRTYEVNIRAKPEELLDWDKPLKQQSPAVYETLRTLGVPDKPHVTGSMAYWDIGGQALTRGKPSQDVPEYASKTLADAGIPGIRYLDQGSRNAAPVIKTTPGGDVISSHYPAPTYNYVVTDPSRLDIMAKYGVLGGAPLGALAAQDQYGAAP